MWVARSTVRPLHKRKNWFIGVIALPDAPEAVARVPASDLRFEAFRAGGAGGQHQNKTESAVRAVHVPTGLTVVARDERSQHRNKAAAIARLCMLLELREEQGRAADKQAVQAAHDRLVRGQPIRRFKGPDFVPG